MRNLGPLVVLLVLSPAWADAPRPALEISAAACAALARGPAYVPGVDAAGNAVAPADLPREPQAVSPDTISIEIDPNLAGKVGVPAPAAGESFRERPILGYVTVSDGRVLFNGKPLAPDAAEAVQSACNAARK